MTLNSGSNPFRTSVNFADMVKAPAFTNGWTYGGSNLWDAASKLNTSQINGLSWGNTGSTASSSGDPFSGLAGFFGPALQAMSAGGGGAAGGGMEAMQQMMGGLAAVGFANEKFREASALAQGKLADEDYRYKTSRSLFQDAPIWEAQKENIASRIQNEKDITENANRAAQIRKDGTPMYGTPGIAHLIPRLGPYGLA